MHGILHSVDGGEDPELASGNIDSSNIEGKIAECATDGRMHMIRADLLTVMRMSAIFYSFQCVQTLLPMALLFFKHLQHSLYI